MSTKHYQPVQRGGLFRGVRDTYAQCVEAYLRMAAVFTGLRHAKGPSALDRMTDAEVEGFNRDRVQGCADHEKKNRR